MYYNVHSASADLTRAGYLIRRSRRAGRVSAASEVIDPIRSDPIRRDQDPHAARRERDREVGGPTYLAKQDAPQWAGSAGRAGPPRHGQQLAGAGWWSALTCLPAYIHTYIHTRASLRSMQGEPGQHAQEHLPNSSDSRRTRQDKT